MSCEMKPIVIVTAPLCCCHQPQLTADLPILTHLKQ